MLWLFALLATLFAGWRAARRLLFFLHLFQLEGYKPARFVHWLRMHPDVLLRRSHAAGALLLTVGALTLPLLGPFWSPALVLLGWCVAFASSRRYRRDRPKKPLAFTPRMRRLLSVAALLTLAGPALGGLLGRGEKAVGWLYYLGGWLVADLGAPLWVLLAGWLLWPVERAIQEGFKRRARRKLAAHPDLTIIGITGSYGKTSTKFIIAEILSLRYQVLATPGSYNTPMGICKVINEQLRPEHQVLVLEMGIRHPGDIRELCAIARPDIGVVTAVGPMHLETMGSIEAIAREKSELVACTRPGGPVVLNADDPRVAAMAERARGPVWRVSVEDNPEADLVARDITYGPEGTRFVVRDETGTEQVFQTRLLGRHNVLNILLALAVGRIFGLRLRQMAHAVARLRPVEHRLQLRREGPITVIDDAFNSNPVGARNALEILGQFRTGRRIVVTPGMVELGAREAEENRALGRFMAQHVDLAVLIGPRRTLPIQEGLREAGFPDDRIRVFRSLFEAQDFLKTYLQPGDVVLYENDLPDQYDEP
ncbi:UDP-N-acetylmuramoyl-tripeptide--D-alanyl-D-alanine ligase [Rhodothermus marinus]|uniref:UDP-N-acetylmuramoyl-tripeptide--D-alanyl-D- alanine ligase n=1 Tax=Rhodothermus marinus TaxID=29549 RepID=UPI0012BA47DC|nr:UDP-N-acetylmuramoyl-tripeptide--D-alanyl-D-alanine ligase [Rhodothermus marinus]BBM70809.1 Mur ligase [Rhodothermus marinus]